MVHGIIATVLAVAITASPAPKKEKKPDKEYLGHYEITAYSYNEGGGENYYTKSGRTPEPYYSVAVDSDYISLGTKLYIEGIGEVRADDTGSAVQGNVIDLHVGYDQTESFGRQVRKVWIVK